MTLGVGISGVHRCGKTTLMQRIAQLTASEPVTTNVGDVFRDMGIKADANLAFDLRMEAQDEILKRLRALLEKARSAGNAFVTDRTPLDLITYTLADVNGKSAGKSADRVLSYVKDCYELNNEFFGFTVILQPGIKLVSADLKGSMCPAYIEHYASLMLGVAMNPMCRNQRIIMPRSVTDLEERLRLVVEEIQKGSQRFEDMHRTLN